MIGYNSGSPEIERLEAAARAETKPVIKILWAKAA
jgi:hypothetical protein